MEDRRLEDWLDTYMEYTNNSEPPDSFRKWCGISAIAACLQRKCSLQWESTIYPNFYIILVGPSGCRKGTAMRQSGAFLRRLGISMSPEAVTREQLIRRLRKSGEGIDGQVITEGGRSILHASLTVFSEELTVFLGYNNQKLVGDLCDWFDCGDKWEYDTKNQGTDKIDNVWVNLLGATTPTLLQTSLPQESIGAGLTSRILFLYEERKGKIVPRPFKTEREIELEVLLFNDLEMILMQYGEYNVSDEYLDTYDKWYIASEKDPIFQDPRLEPYLTRRSLHIRKLSMIMNASRRDGNMQLEKIDFDRAVGELAKVEKKMPMAFRGIGQSDIASITHNVMMTVGRRRTITFGELLRAHYHDADRDTMSRIVDTMITIGYCRWKDIGKKLLEYIPEKDVIK